MSRVSRRQRAHEEQAGKRKLRNLFALLFAAIAIGVAAAVIYALYPRGDTTIHVLIQKIQTSNYYDQDGQIKTRRHAVPFQDETCDQLADAFSQFSNTVIADVEPIQGLNEKVGLSEEAIREIKDNAISLLYVNGHLMLSQDEEVVWIYPDQQEQEFVTYNVKDALADFAVSPGRQKIVFLDAGQFSWCPNHPNRNQLPFQDHLDQIIKAIAPETNLWVVLSHGPNEISLTCTPENTSIFGLAIQQTLETMGTSDSITELFNGIYQRCAYYSTNFGGEVLQSPLLYRAGTGLVQNLVTENVKIEFARSFITALDEEPEKQVPVRQFQESFTGRDQFALSNLEEWLAKYAVDLHEQPVISMFNVENHIEPGQNLTQLSLTNNEYDFDSLTPAVRQKHEMVAEFRKNCVDLCLQLRAANLLQIWASDQRRIVRRLFQNAADAYNWTPLIAYDDEELKLAATSDSNALQRWNRGYDDLIDVLHNGWIFNNDNFGVPRTARDEKDQLVLTPLQAELLGVVTQRLLPFCKTPVAKQEETSSDDDSETRSSEPQRMGRFEMPYSSYTLSLDLPAESTLPKYSPKNNTQTCWQDSFKQFNSLLTSRQLETYTASEDDTNRRVRLAAFGSEDMLELAPAEIDVYAGEPAINIEFEDKIAIHPGHNFFRGNIRNSAGFYRISAELSEEDSESTPGIEHFLFQEDRLFENEDRTVLETGGKFIFYVFARPMVDRGNEKKRIEFSFTAQSLSGGTEPLVKTVNLKVDSDPLISVKSVRDVGTFQKESRQVGMMPWRTNAISDFGLSGDQILKLNSLANLKSRFEFQFSNQSSIALDQLSMNLYMLSDTFFNDIPADAIPDEDLNEALGLRTWNQVNFFSDRSKYRLLASATDVTIFPGRPHNIRFSVPDQSTDKEEDGEGGAPKAPIEALIRVGAPLLLTMSDGAIGDAPLWFQFIEISPVSPFYQSDWQGSIGDSPFQIGDLLKQRNQFFDFELFSAHLPLSEELAGYFDGPVTNCMIHFISDSLKQSSFQMGLEDAFANQQFNVPQMQGQKTIAMIDAMGIPNVVSMLIDNDQSATLHSKIRKSFAGFRLESDFWESHQSGFLYNSELFDSPEDPNLASQKIYLRRKAEAPDAAVGKIKLHFSLPFGQLNSPVKSRQNFSYSWNRGAPTPLMNPTERNHFIETKDFSFISTVKRHSYPTNIVVDSVDIPLKIYWGTDSLAKLIGSWIVTTSNPNTNASIRLSNNSVNNPGAKIAVDFSAVEPYCSDTKVGLKGSEGMLIKDIPKVFKSVGDKKYQFAVKDLLNALQIDLNAEIQQKREAGGGTIIKTFYVETVDFFGKQLRQEVTLSQTVRKPRKPTSTRKKTNDDG